MGSPAQKPPDGPSFLAGGIGLIREGVMRRALITVKRPQSIVLSTLGPSWITEGRQALFRLSVLISAFVSESRSPWMI